MPAIALPVHAASTPTPPTRPAPLAAPASTPPPLPTVGATTRARDITQTPTSAPNMHAPPARILTTPTPRRRATAPPPVDTRAQRLPLRPALRAGIPPAARPVAPAVPLESTRGVGAPVATAVPLDSTLPPMACTFRAPCVTRARIARLVQSYAPRAAPGKVLLG